MYHGHRRPLPQRAAALLTQRPAHAALPTATIAIPAAVSTATTVASASVTASLAAAATAASVPTPTASTASTACLAAAVSASPHAPTPTVPSRQPHSVRTADRGASGLTQRREQCAVPGRRD